MEKKRDEHKIKIEELYTRLKTSKKGLSEKEAEKRLKRYGPNILKLKKGVPEIVKFLKHLFNFFAILLWIGSILAFISEAIYPGEGNLYIGIALIGVVILNALFSYYQEHKAEKIMESFIDMMPTHIDVIRDNTKKEITADKLVPGDIIVLKEGDKIPADARIIEFYGLKVNHSALTGESEPQLRKLEYTSENILESRNMIFSGTLVQTGTAKAVVYETGMTTQIGRIADLSKTTKFGETPIRKQLNHFIKIISVIAIFLGITFGIISIVMGKHLMGSLIFAIGIIVANVPEGLLPTVTLGLSVTSKKMAKKKALVKDLESVETLGSTTAICTDKTGTLTENKMSVKTLYFNFEEFDCRGSDYKDEPGLDKILMISALCNNSRLNSDCKSYKGDPTDGALLLFAYQNTNITKIFYRNKRINESPFDSKRKRMITSYFSKPDGQHTAYLKGAPEVILKMCNRILINGEVKKFTKKDKDKISEYYNKLASRGERIIALAYAGLKSDKLAKNFIFTSLIGMYDPPRKEVKRAIKKCRQAGIKVIMITGDAAQTAESVAKQVRIIKDKKNDIVVTGKKLSQMNEDALKDVLSKKNIIFARTNPFQKLRIVKTLKSMGHTVAVTGDGVNDAPALKNADIGVSMGVIGTDVAKEASNMVLMDDNFATIVSAIEQGRTIYDNIKKFIVYILTSNIPEILPFIAFAILGIPLPLTVILILSIDLGTDLIPALGIGYEEPEDDIMKRKPRPRKEPLMTWKMLFRSYGIVGPIEAMAGFTTYFYVLFSGGWQWGSELAVSDPLYIKAVSAFFAPIIICQIANVMICRTKKESIFKKGFLTNKVVLLGILSEIILLSIILYFPPANKLFGTSPVEFRILAISLPFAIVIFLGDELRKKLLRKGNRFIKKCLSW